MKIIFTVRALIGVALCASMTGCTVQLYSGEELPEAEASHLTVRRASPDIVLEAVSVDGKAVPSYARSVLVEPGDHLISIKYMVEVREMCDLRDYSCPATLLQGKCEGYLATTAGSRDIIAVDSARGVLRASVQQPQVIGLLRTTDGAPVRDIPCSKPSRFDEIGRTLR
jgi:hypothetical protein